MINNIYQNKLYITNSYSHIIIFKFNLLNQNYVFYMTTFIILKIIFINKYIYIKSYLFVIIT